MVLVIFFNKQDSLRGLVTSLVPPLPHNDKKAMLLLAKKKRYLLARILKYCRYFVRLLTLYFLRKADQLYWTQCHRSQSRKFSVPQHRASLTRGCMSYDCGGSFPAYQPCGYLAHRPRQVSNTNLYSPVEITFDTFRFKLFACLGGAFCVKKAKNGD